MKRGPSSGEVTMLGPELMPCGAFLSQRIKTARCQKCYGRKVCRCAFGTAMACDSGTHWAIGAQRTHHSARLNRGFVDINRNRRGINAR